MKKSYSWQLLLVSLAIYLILLAFFPSLNLIFDYIRLSLLLALAFLWLGTEYKNAILFCLGLAFSAFYIREITPYSYLAFNGAPLFFGLLVLGIALHSIGQKRRHNRVVEVEAEAQYASYANTDSDYLVITNQFDDRFEQATSTKLESVSLTTTFGHTTLNLTKAGFAKETTYVTIKNTCAACVLQLPRDVAVVNYLKSNLGDINLPQQPSQTNAQIYLTGTNTAGSITVVYVD